ncbi:iron-sulfur cluster assembly scaffold protein [Photobacterium lipolyticum]|uniref:Iron-sulfur cluster assembly scaffold protein n=1 Tax=Photobacterium lipolyticum TaxID=266810 RepID=A0A2T3N2W3_9GAMM|nr:iron-sulfur cluster assembly scaffold protein [Photobacterium lipolyticum]PSW06710.1 iron-sulfur cluster assembly scaffold protein [Photobacterium lipolyticum]
MFNEVIVDNFSNPSHQGEVDSAQANLKLGNPVCGDTVNISLQFESADTVSEAKFQAWGCATSLAMANVFCRYVEGRKLTEIKEVEADFITSLLGELEPSQHHCLEMLNELFDQCRSLEVA